MSKKKSSGAFRARQIFLWWWFLICLVGNSDGDTNPADVAAINSLYISMGSPTLPGWVASGGDPCGEAWQGVTCDNMNHILSVTLNGANLGGELGDDLGAFTSIKSIDLSNNNIGGSIPSNLPVTMQTFFLSDNKFTGSIPSSISTLTELVAMSLNDNQLSGDIPDAFEGLAVLVNLDLSNNNLNGPLPPSMQNLSALSTLHVQNNQLSGTLDVLQNVENNQFSGPIPPKLLSIPNFKDDGNPFNTSITPSPPPTPSTKPPPAPSFFGSPLSAQTPPTSGRSPGMHSEGPSATAESNSKTTGKSVSTKRVVWISIASVLSFIVLVLALILFMPRCFRRRREMHMIAKRHEIAPYMGNREVPRNNGSVGPPVHHKEKAESAVAAKPREELQTGPRKGRIIPKPREEQEENVKNGVQFQKWMPMR